MSKIKGTLPSHRSAVWFSKQKCVSHTPRTLKNLLLSALATQPPSEVTPRVYDKNSQRTHKRSSFDLADKVTQQARQHRGLKRQTGAGESRSLSKAASRQSSSPAGAPHRPAVHQPGQEAKKHKEYESTLLPGAAKRREAVSSNS